MKLSKIEPASGLVGTGDHVAWDTDVTGLGLRHRDGRRTWIVQTRVNGRSRKKTLGTADGLDLSAAREMAREVIAAWQSGQGLTSSDHRLDRFAKRFMADCAGQWKPSTIRSHDNNLRFHILPILGKRRLGEVTRQDVVAWQEGLDLPASTKNRSMAVLSGLFRHAEVLGRRSWGGGLGAEASGIEPMSGSSKARVWLQRH